MPDVYICIHMGTNYKSVRLTEDAYEVLERRKREEESFSETIERLAAERPICDLVGVFTGDEVESIRSARSDAYDEYADHRTERWES